MPADGGAVGQLRETQSLSLTHAATLRAARAAADAERSAARAETSLFEPFLELQREGISGSFDDEPNAASYVRVGTPFHGPFQIGSTRRVREATDALASATLRAERLAVVHDATRAWLDAAHAEAKRAIVERIAERVDRAVALDRERLALGEIAGTELVQLELEQARAVALVSSVEAERGAARAMLMRLAGPSAPLPNARAIGDLARTLDPPPSTAVAISERIGTSAAIQQARARRAAAEARAKLARRTAHGVPEADVEWERIPDVDGAEGFDAWGFRVRVPLPFGSAGRAEIDRARAEVLRADADVAALEAVLRAEAQATSVEVESARERLAALEAVLARSTRTESSLSEQFRLGAIDYVQYLDGLRRLDDVRLEGLDARHALLAARLRLAVLVDDASIFPLVSLSPEERAR
jgi:cobalt-zinc-cadmium efflux system outer membrane protein